MIPRYLPGKPLPPYSYVSGHFPHPIRDPAGHMHGHDDAVCCAPDPRRWSESPDYLYGIDLFNHGYYWESHEQWEGLWHACQRTGAVGDFLKALIKLAAAGVKARERRPAGVTRHARRACELFKSVAEEAAGSTSSFMGLDLRQLARQASELAASPPATMQNTPLPEVERLLDIQLRPT
jgi:predicted metal-dependent hydrolase